MKNIQEPKEFWSTIKNLGIIYESFDTIPIGTSNLEWIVEYKLYEVNFINIYSLVIGYLDIEEDIYPRFLTIIQEPRYAKLWDSVKDYFNSVVEEYIKYPIEPKEFRNSKEDTLKILDSNISEEAKEVFKKYNKTIVDEE